MAFLRQAAAVIAGNGRHHQVLRLGIAQQLTMTNQVPGVFVVSADVDVLATGMEHRGSPKQFTPFATVVMHHASRGVVEA